MPAVPLILVGAAATGVAATIGTAVAATLVGATVSTVAATAIGTGIIAGTITAAQGGSVSDVLKSAVVGGVATYVGGYVGDVVGTSVASATGSTLAGSIVGNVASGVAQAVVRGEDLEKGAIAGLAASAGSVLGNIPGFKDLPKPVQAAVTATARAAVSGQDVPAALAQSLITSTGIIDSAIKSVPGSSTVLTNESNKDAVQLVTGTLSGALTAALQGKNVGDAAKRALINTSADILSKSLFDGIAREQLNKDIAATQAKYTATKDAQANLKANYDSQTYYVDKYNGVVNTVKDMGAEHQRLVDDYNTKRATWQAKVDAGDTEGANAYVDNVNAAAKAADDYVTKYNKYWEDNKGNLDTYKTKIDELKKAYPDLEAKYNETAKTLETASSALGKNVGTFTDNSNKSFVTALDPNFNAAEYRAINNLPADADVYEHYLSTGMNAGLPTNSGAAQPKLLAEKNRIIEEVAAAKGVAVNQLAPADIAAISKKLNDTYGSNLGALDTVTGAKLVQDAGGADKLLTNSAKAGYKPSTDTVYGAWKPPASGSYTPPAGLRYATADEVNRGAATSDYTKDGQQVWIHKSGDYSYNEFDPVTGELKAVVVVGRRLTEEEKLRVAAEQDPETDNTFGSSFINAAKRVVDWAKETGNSTTINTAANVIKAGGGFLESINGISVLAGYAPKNTALGKFADALQSIGKAGNTAEYQAAIKNMQGMIGDAKGVGGTLKAIYGAFKSAPLEFLAEYVGVEGIQEIAPLLIGGVAATGAKGATLALKYGEAVAAKIGAGAGLSAAMTTDIIESAGGSAKSAYDEAFAAARKAGKSTAEADKIALDIAQRSALVAAGTTAVSMGLGGAAIEKALLGRTGTGLGDALQSLGDFAKTGTKIAIKEGAAEAGEEGVIQAFLETQLYKLDPTRDVAGNITAAAAFGAIAGGPIAGGAYAGSRTGDVISNALLANPTVANTINNAPNASVAAQELSKLGVSDSVSQANLLNTKFDAAYTSSDEAAAALGRRTDFVATDADIKALTGATSNLNLAGEVEKYIDPRVLDIEEVKAAARAEGYTISDAEAAKLVGQKDEAAAVAAARAQFDPLATNYDEAKQFFTDRGYTPSADEIRQFVGSKAETDQTKAVADYVNPRQVTTEEAKKYLTDLGYKPTDAEVKRFVGQVNEAEQATKVGEYVDPRMVDEGEVKAAYEALGLKKPTADDIKKLMGQYAETDLAGKAEASLPTARYNSVLEQLESLSVGASPEVLNAIETVKADFTNQVKDLGFKMDEQTGTLTDAITTTEKNILDKIAENEKAGLTRDQATQKAVADVAAELGTTKEDILTRLGTTETNLNKTIDTLSKDVSALSTKVGEVETNILTKMAEYEKSGIQRDEALSKAIDDVAKNLGTTREDLLKQIGTTETALKEQVSGVETSLGTKITESQEAILKELGLAKTGLSEEIEGVKGDLTTKIGDIETNILDRMAQYEKAGISRDEALGRAVDDVATQLGTTREDILTKVGETEQRLGTQIGDLQTTVGQKATPATQQDLDAVINLLQQQGAYDPQYDYNGDRVIDQKDKVAIETVLRSQQPDYKPDPNQPFRFDPAAGTKWAPTGVFGEIGDLERRTIEEAERTRQANAQAALKTQRLGNLNTMMQMLGQAGDAGGQQVTVKAADPAKIGYIYDWSSIFANPSQQQLFASPYAQGGAVRGEVDDVNDELLKILRG
jgi:predicted Zn-dependent protease with MMP-like domain